MQKLRSPATVNRKILRAAVVVAAASVIVKAAATGKELAVANCFGRGDVLDAFLIAFLVPSFVVALISGSFNAALIPTFIQVREQQGREAAQALFSNVVVLSQGMLLGVAALLAAAGPRLLAVLGSGFAPAKLALTVHLFYALLPLVIVNGLVMVWASVLNAGERFLMAALTPLSTPLASFIFLLGFGRAWGIWAYVAGTLAGGVVEAALLAYALRRHEFRLRPQWQGMDAATRQVCAQWAPVLVGALLTGGVGFVDQSMAGMLREGSVAALSFATRIIVVISALLTNPMSTAVIPYFSAMAANGDVAGCRKTLRTYSRLVLAVAVPITAALVVFSRPLIQVLYQRGAFTAADTVVVARVQALYSLQIPFYAVSILHVRLLSALKRNDLLLYAAGINLSLDVVFNLICMQYWGVAGIALSTSLFYLVSCAFVVVCARRVLRRVSAAPVGTLGFCVPAAAAEGDD